MKFKVLIISASLVFSFLTSCSSINSENSDSVSSQGNFENSEGVVSQSVPESTDTSFNGNDASSGSSCDTNNENSGDFSELNSDNSHNLSESISDVADNSEITVSGEASADSSQAPDSSDDLYSEDTSTELFFNEPDGSEHTTEKGNFFETNCTDGAALEIMKKIADIASEYNKVTVYYTDVEQKYYFAYGANLTHNTASTIKAPYAVFLLKKGIDLEEKLTMEKHHIFTGSGVLKNKPVGSVFTVKELIKYMITRSDNTAYAMLLDRFGAKGFTEYADSLGVDFKIPSGGYTTCKIREMATFMLDIYKYKDTELGAMLIDYMKSCSYSLQIPKATEYPVAHKFGFIYEGKAFHDMGIVFAPSPYIELIFTKIDGTVYDTGAFLKIGRLVEELNQVLSDEY